ncbi:MFS transporter, SP family, solute carrier family 2 (myo-inositol transporter), member 13 [Cryptococcus neoformans Bt63]|nr:MFS transporter, SP family, solute carrier family 2 (myo-inositol transporter), member 13 [Cryptococcus neoformans var. grubii Bt63]
MTESRSLSVSSWSASTSGERAEAPRARRGRGSRRAQKCWSSVGGCGGAGWAGGAGGGGGGATTLSGKSNMLRGLHVVTPENFRAEGMEASKEETFAIPSFERNCIGGIKRAVARKSNIFGGLPPEGGGKASLAFCA